jgi:hypothetical protein
MLDLLDFRDPSTFNKLSRNLVNLKDFEVVEGHPNLKMIYPRSGLGDFECSTSEFVDAYYYDTNTKYIWFREFTYVTNTLDNKLRKLPLSNVIDIGKELNLEVNYEEQPETYNL